MDIKLLPMPHLSFLSYDRVCRMFGLRSDIYCVDVIRNVFIEMELPDDGTTAKVTLYLDEYTLEVKYVLERDAMVDVRRFLKKWTDCCQASYRYKLLGEGDAGHPMLLRWAKHAESLQDRLCISVVTHVEAV